MVQEPRSRQRRSSSGDTKDRSSVLSISLTKMPIMAILEGSTPACLNFLTQWRAHYMINIGKSLDLVPHDFCHELANMYLHSVVLLCALLFLFCRGG